MECHGSSDRFVLSSKLTGTRQAIHQARLQEPLYIPHLPMALMPLSALPGMPHKHTQLTRLMHVLADALYRVRQRVRT